MLHLALWFIYLGLSFLVEGLGWTEQGKAFLYIDIGSLLLIILIILAIDLYEHFVDGYTTWDYKESLRLALVSPKAITILFFVTLGVSKLFDVDFYVAYQIMKLGFCLHAPKSKKKYD